MNKLSLKEYIRPDLELSEGENNLLLHSCCAPCAGEIMEAVAAANIKTTVYFYNPNIHPLEEYEIRKEENKRLGRLDADHAGQAQLHELSAGPRRVW